MPPNTPTSSLTPLLRNKKQTTKVVVTYAECAISRSPNCHVCSDTYWGDVACSYQPEANPTKSGRAAQTVRVDRRAESVTGRLLNMNRLASMMKMQRNPTHTSTNL